MIVQTPDCQFVQLSVIVVPRVNIHTRWSEEMRKVLKKLLYTIEGIKKMM